MIRATSGATSPGKSCVNGYSYNGVQAAVLSRPGCRLILAKSLLTSKNTRVAGVYPRSYSQALCVACQHWGLAGGLHCGTRECLRATLPVSCTVYNFCGMYRSFTLWPISI